MSRRQARLRRERMPRLVVHQSAVAPEVLSILARATKAARSEAAQGVLVVLHTAGDGARFYEHGQSRLTMLGALHVATQSMTRDVLDEDTHDC